MKIYTDYIDMELTIDEFESIIDSGLLDTVIATIASLSIVTEYAVSGKPNSKAYETINQILKDSEDHYTDGVNDDEDIIFSPDDNFYDEGFNEDEYKGMDEDNKEVQRIYDTLFGERL